LQQHETPLWLYIDFILNKKKLQAHVHVLAMPKLNHSPWFSSHLCCIIISSK